MQMNNLEARITKLATTEEIRRRMMEFGDACDLGGASGETYDSRAMTDLWTKDGEIVNGAGRFDGSEEIFALLDDLAQVLSLHFSANYIVDVGSDGNTATGHWYVWEAPILSGKAVLGSFTHEHVYVRIQDQWFWRSWHQTEHFFSEFTEGWVDGTHVLEQRASLGA
jgi:hypothetical protein